MQPDSQDSAPALRSSARRLYLTVLFADLSNSTALAQAMEAEHYADLLDGMRLACRQIVPRHGGIVVRMQGDGVLAVFGYPQAAENDGCRATEAALELHAAVRQLQPQGRRPATGGVALHTGIHAGLVLVAEGDMERGRLELMGNTPNVAARLSDAAAFDQILVSDETLGPGADRFVTGPPQPYRLQGCELPVPALRVHARASGHGSLEARAARSRAPFIGRQAELQALERCLHDALAGPAGLVRLEGDTGMGKSRLLDEFLRLPDIAGCTVFRGHCDGHAGAEPLQPFLQMLRTLFGLTHEMSAAEAAAAALGTLARLDPGARVDPPALLEALSLAPPTAAWSAAPLGALFGLLAEARPLVLVIDDWHWADDASRQVLGLVREACPRGLVLLAQRPQPDGLPPEPHTRRLVLQPLAAQEAAAAVDRLLPGAAGFVASEIHAYAGGNPLFIEELCHSAAVEDTGHHLRRRHRSGAWLDALIESRVARLPADQAGVVRAAAVIGNVFPAWLLERLTGHGAGDPLLAALAEHDFLFPAERAGELRFKHGITRDVVYDAVGLRQRQALHLQVAQELAAHAGAHGHEDLSAALAYHYGAAGSADEAARFALAAGDKAMAAFALDRARTQYCAALRAFEQLGLETPEGKRRWCEAVQRLGLACVFDPLGLADSVELFDRGVALAAECGDAQTLARAEYWLGYVCYAKGLARAATRHCRSALARAERLPGGERLAAQVRATLGQVLASTAEYGEALERLDDAVQAKRRWVAGRGNVAVGSAFSLSCKGLVLGDRGAFDDAQACFDEALGLIQGSGHQVESSIRGLMSTVYLWQGRWDDSARAADEAVRIGDHVRSSHLVAIHRALAGYARWRSAGLPDALQPLQDAATWIETHRGGLFMSLLYGCLADGHLACGRIAPGRAAVARALVRTREGDRLGEAMAWRALALQAATTGDRPTAERALAQALKCAAARGSAHERAATWLAQAQTALALGDAGSVQGPLDQASAAFERLGMHWHREQAEQAWRRLS